MTLSELKRSDRQELSLDLPEASTDEIVGLLKVLVRLSYGRRIGLSELAEAITYDDERLLVLLQLLDMLDFSVMSNGWVKLTRVGRTYATSADHARRVIFANQLAKRIPVMAYVRGLLEGHSAGAVALDELRADLQARYPDADIAPTLRRVIAWARYAGLFYFDQRTGLVSLGRPGTSSRSIAPRT
jgi:NitT/TauT family transport system ATP-binding protein